MPDKYFVISLSYISLFIKEKIKQKLVISSKIDTFLFREENSHLSHRCFSKYIHLKQSWVD